MRDKFQISYDKLNSRSIEFYKRAFKLSKQSIISSKIETIYFMNNTLTENKKMQENFYVIILINLIIRSLQLYLDQLYKILQKRETQINNQNIKYLLL